LIDKAGVKKAPLSPLPSPRRNRSNRSDERRKRAEIAHSTEQRCAYPQQESIRKGLLDWRCSGGASTLVGKPVELCGIRYSREWRCKRCKASCKAPSVLIFDRFVRADSPIGCYTQSVPQDHRCTQRADCPSYNRILRQSTEDSFDEHHYKTVPLSVLLVVGTVSY
jgi:hypothetical protein